MFCEKEDCKGLVSWPESPRLTSCDQVKKAGEERPRTVEQNLVSHHLNKTTPKAATKTKPRKRHTTQHIAKRIDANPQDSEGNSSNGESEKTERHNLVSKL